MINFDAVDFSERRPEKVISFFWRSVYDSYCKKLKAVSLVHIATLVVHIIKFSKEKKNCIYIHAVNLAFTCICFCGGA